jgi:hypothetical protein
MGFTIITLKNYPLLGAGVIFCRKRAACLRVSLSTYFKKRGSCLRKIYFEPMISLLTIQATAFLLFSSKHPGNDKNKNRMVIQEVK